MSSYTQNQHARRHNYSARASLYGSAPAVHPVKLPCDHCDGYHHAESLISKADAYRTAQESIALCRRTRAARNGRKVVALW